MMYSSLSYSNLLPGGWPHPQVRQQQQFASPDQTLNWSDHAAVSVSLLYDTFLLDRGFSKLLVTK